MRAIIEFVFLIVFIWVARAILTRLLSGFKEAAGIRPTEEAERKNVPLKGADLHKDPVCGTYVVDSTSFQRQIGATRFYYCSEQCREKHALVSR